MKYIIKTQAVVHRTYEVEADNEKDALYKFSITGASLEEDVCEETLSIETEKDDGPLDSDRSDS